MKEITYYKEGDYLISNLVMKNFKKNDYYIGKYRHLRLTYLKRHKKVLN